MLRGPLSILVAGLCLALLAFWIPQYVHWAWWTDAGEFDFLAQQWDQGIDLPYRDLLCFNFPSEIYLHWVLGKLFGWGSTRAFYAFDAALVVALGAAMVAWSRRVLGLVLPGSLAFLAFLAFYLDQGYETVGQRDWHAMLLGVVGLMVVDAGRGRFARVVAGLLLAFGFSFRPQIILLAPAYLFAIDTMARRGGASRWRSVLAILEWGIVLAIGVALAFAPLIRGGLFDDFLWGTWGLGHVRPGGNYNVEGVGARIYRFLAQVNPAVVALVAVNVGFAARQTESRRTYLIWLIALVSTSVYRPLSPYTSNLYLIIPFRVVLCMQFPLAAYAILRTPGIVPSFRLIAMSLLIALTLPAKPRFAQSQYTRAFLRGQTVVQGRPPSYVANPHQFSSARYVWEDYQDLLAYLIQNTTPETRVANVLDETPSVLGNVPRPSVFPTPALNFVKVDQSLLPYYTKCLEEAPAGSVVVWSPDEVRDIQEILSKGRGRGNAVPHVWDAFQPAIERNYVPEKKFGEIEVWRRRPGK